MIGSPRREAARRGPADPTKETILARLAARMGRIGESATLAITRRVKELQAAGREILDLGAGEPDFDSPAVAVEAAARALHEGFTRYTENAGTLELRRALAERFRERYGTTPWGAGEVLITVGAKAGLFELAMALLEPGRELASPSRRGSPAPRRCSSTPPRPTASPSTPSPFSSASASAPPRY
jgi:aspartate aminotransferase